MPLLGGLNQVGGGLTPKLHESLGFRQTGGNYDLAASE